MSAFSEAASDEDADEILALRKRVTELTRAAQMARDWISEKPDNRLISAGRMVALLHLAVSVDDAFSVLTNGPAGIRACADVFSDAPQPPQADTGIPASEQFVPAFGLVAKRKLDCLLSDGWAVSGYSIIKQLPSGEMKQGFVTAGGLVGWWQQPNSTQPTQSAPAQWVGLTDKQIATIKKDATAIFCSTPASTPMFVSDMIEWYDSTLTVMREKNGGTK